MYVLTEDLGGFKFEYFVEFLRIFMTVTVALSVE